MKYRQLGKTGLRVSEIGFGAFGIGGGYQLAEKHGADAKKVAIDAIACAYDRGINFFDSCPFNYAIFQNPEALIGETLKDVRENIILATKVERFDQAEGKDIARICVEESLKSFNTDYLDIVQIRDPNPEKVTKFALMESLEKLRDEGKVRFISVSVGDTHIQKQTDYSIDNGFSTVQLAYNLIFRDAEQSIFQRAAETQTGIIARGPLCKGFLSERDLVKGNRRWFTDEENGALDEIRSSLEFLAAPGRDLAQAAIQFVLRQQAIATTIISLESAADVKNACDALNLPMISNDDWKKAYEIINKYPFIEY